MKIRGSSTNQLSDIIQTLSVARKTGVLVVEREDNAGSSELGSITFNNGQVIDANIGALRGADAYKKLSSWKTCQFLFQAPSPIATPPQPPQPHAYTMQSGPVMPPNQSNAYPTLPGNIVPYRAQLMQAGIPDFQQYGLSRMHRQLFLLIDGRRSVEVLTRLIGRNFQEVRIMLADLERAGLIHQ